MITHFQECNQDWVFTADEQAFYAEKALMNIPGRCKECRKKLKDARRRRNRRMKAKRNTGAGAGAGADAMDGEEKTPPSGPKICYAFQTNECTRGESCRFEHILKGEEA
jgi:hypothetical protein